jgi:hypothetical protein
LNINNIYIYIINMSEGVLNDRINMLSSMCVDPLSCTVTPLHTGNNMARAIPFEPTIEERRERAARAAERRAAERRLTLRRTPSVRTGPQSTQTITPSQARTLMRTRTPQRTRSPMRSRAQQRTRPQQSPPPLRRNTPENNSDAINNDIARFLNDLDQYHYNNNNHLMYRQSDNLRSMLDNRNREARIRRAVHGSPEIGPLSDYIGQQCIGAHCGALQDPTYYADLKNRARTMKQRDLHNRLINRDIPKYNAQRLRAAQHDVSDRITELNPGLNPDIMSRVHHFLREKGIDEEVLKRYESRRG